MTLPPNRALGPYVILEPIGAGGMGEVYRARDTRLQREVAIKVLPEALADDPDYLARFEREARLLGSLSHPHIATLHGLESSEEAQLLVMELVPGETLAQRLARGPLDPGEAMDVFRQIAEALEAAHERGIVHRDLKPANVKITPDGVVKVLDFGLAKGMEGESGPVDLSKSPTRTHNETQAGLVLGTVSYMSPEQARGKRVDKRTDVWAFGCSLYEALAGVKAFGGETASDVIGAVLRGEPDWALLPAAAPARLRALIRRCLQKDARRRLRDIGDARIELEELLAGGEAGPPAAALARGGRSAWWVAAAFLAGALLAGALGWLLAPRAAPPAVTRLRLGLEPASQLGWLPGFDVLERPSRAALALSTDGRRVVFSGMKDGKPQIYVRALDQELATPLAGTEGAAGLFLSPDGQWVGFWSSGALRKVALAGGPAVTLCETTLPDGATWGEDGQIVYALDGLWTVPAVGGPPRALTTPDAARGEVSHRLPHALPGGGLLFTVKRSVIWGWERAQIVLQPAGGGERAVLIEGGADARYVPSGHLVYAQAGTLMAVPFDLGARKLAGSPVPLFEGLMQAQNGDSPPLDSGAAQFSVSADGSLVYARGGVYPQIQQTMVFVGRDGQRQALPAPPHPYLGPRLSPDGRRVAVQFRAALWRYDLQRDTLTRLQGDAGFPVWTPDARHILFTTPTGLRRIGSDGGEPETLTSTTGMTMHFPMSVSPDGRRLLYVEARPGGKSDVWELPLGGGGEPAARLRSAFDERHPQFSPDGRWLAYTSDETGRDEVYVRAAGEGGGTHQVSPAGGAAPQWAPSGRELVFRREGQLMAVEVKSGDPPRFGLPRALFALPGRPEYLYTRDYDLSPDGKRFLVLQPREAPSAAAGEAQIVLGWSITLP